jgi:hypothetical protein
MDMERRLLPPEKFFIVSVDQYMALLKAEQVHDCFSGLEYLAHRESFLDRIIVVRANVAEQIRARYGSTKRAFYGANRDVEFTSQTVLDVDEFKA